jgi:hypothetical protein
MIFKKLKAKEETWESWRLISLSWKLIDNQERFFVSAHFSVSRKSAKYLQMDRKNGRDNIVEDRSPVGTSNAAILELADNWKFENES